VRLAPARAARPARAGIIENASNITFTDLPLMKRCREPPDRDVRTCRPAWPAGLAR